MKLTHEDKIQIAIWVGALRSGLFTQTKGRLQDGGGHCCLGVACELFSKNNPINGDYLTGTSPITSGYDIPQWLNLVNGDVKEKTGRSLIELNDLDSKTFKQIANIIEKTYLKD